MHVILPELQNRIYPSLFDICLLCNYAHNEHLVSTKHKRISYGQIMKQKSSIKVPGVRGGTRSELNFELIIIHKRNFVIYTLRQICFCDTLKEVETGRAYSPHGRGDKFPYSFSHNI